MLSYLTTFRERGMSTCQGQLVIKRPFAVLEALIEGPTKLHLE
jgi:hypothetical protein